MNLTGRPIVQRGTKWTRTEAERWYAAVHSIGYCVLCGTTRDIECAHSNRDRGKGQKSPPWMTASLCKQDHFDIDNGPGLIQEERRAIMDRAIKLTHAALIERGLLALTVKAA